MISHFISGQACPKSTATSAEVLNPATGKVINEVALANDVDIENAVTAAKKAFSNWSTITPLRRARVLFKFKALLEQHLEELAKIITQEHGKTLSDAKGEVLRGIEVVEFACGIPELLKGGYSANVGTGVDSYDFRQPLGVCVGITPFNFPAMVPMWMFPVAIACGNTFILKPSERDPSTANKLAELLHLAGLPAGVFNVVHGDGAAVNALLKHKDVAAVSFVGSTPIAQHVYTTATKLGKRVQALGGAKNHCVVMPDAELETVANGLMGAAFGSAGERCMAISVAVVIGDAVADKLIKKLTAKISNLKVLNGMDANSEMGPLISKQQQERVKKIITSAAKEGAELVVDGRDLVVTGCEAGFFVGATLVDNVKPSMQVYQEEIFGPVLCVVRVKSLIEAIELINNNQYANGTAIYTNNGAASREFVAKIEVGMVGVNVPIPVPMAFHSFGGWKSSLFGDMHVHGKEGVNFYTRLKTITERWPTTSLDAQFVMPVMS